MAKTIRVDEDVRASLDRIRDRYGDANYADAIRRVLRWDRIVKGHSSTPPGTRRWSALMPGLRDILDAATPPDHGEETWEQKQAWDRSNEASNALAALAPELAALVLDMGEFLNHEVTAVRDPEQWTHLRLLLARLSRLGAGDSNPNEKEPGDE